MAAVQIRYQGKERTVPLAGTTQQADGRVMLVRQRKSRIYFLRRFFDYPIQLTTQTLLNLGPMRTMLAGASYLRAALFPKRAEQTLEDFLVNRFGRQLYRMFFESYTEKVWGVPCRQINAEWGAQRIKGLSLRGGGHAFLQDTPAQTRQQVTEESLEELRRSRQKPP